VAHKPARKDARATKYRMLKELQVHEAGKSGDGHTRVHEGTCEEDGRPKTWQHTKDPSVARECHNAQVGGCAGGQ
jgi:hypothetical protein